MVFHQNNIEEYLLDYLENNLTKSEREAVEAYLAEHPETLQDIDQLQQFELQAQPVVYQNKSDLIRNESILPNHLFAKIGVAAAFIGLLTFAAFQFLTPEQPKISHQDETIEKSTESKQVDIEPIEEDQTKIIEPVQEPNQQMALKKSTPVSTNKQNKVEKQDPQINERPIKQPIQIAQENQQKEKVKPENKQAIQPISPQPVQTLVADKAKTTQQPSVDIQPIQSKTTNEIASVDESLRNIEIETIAEPEFIPVTVPSFPQEPIERAKREEPNPTIENALEMDKKKEYDTRNGFNPLNDILKEREKKEEAKDVFDDILPSIFKKRDRKNNTPQRGFEIDGNAPSLPKKIEKQEPRNEK